MMKSKDFDEFVHQFTALLPEDLRQTRRDLEKNMKALMSAQLARMDLVTREEFDLQSDLLSRTRALLVELEQKVSRLEAELNKDR